MTRSFSRWPVIELVLVFVLSAYFFFLRIAPGTRTRPCEPGQWTYSPEAVQLASFPVLKNVGQTTLHPDESNGIFPSMLWEPFIRGEFDSPVWGENFWTLTQPPVMRYLIGIGRNLGGYGPDALKTYWDFNFGPDENSRRGAVPSPDLLWWSRAPMAALNVLSLVLLFAMVRDCCGRLAAWFFLGLFLFNPFIKDAVSRAMTESPLVFFTTCAMAALVRSVRAWLAGGRAAPLAWALTAGLCIGLAGAAKLNALAAVVAGGLVVAVAACRSGAGPVRRRAVYAVSGSLVIGLAAVAVFVAVNPFLYPDPLGRTKATLDNRVTEMKHQMEIFPDRCIQGAGERAAVVTDRVFSRFATLRFPGAPAINILFAAIGAGWLLVQFVRWMRAGDGPVGAVEPVVFGAFFGVVGLPNLLTPIDWDRYFLLPVLWASLFFAAGLALVLRGAMRRFALATAP